MLKVDDLTHSLGLTEQHLRSLASSFPSLVEKRKKKKNSGEYRWYLAPEKPLLKAQRLIDKKILKTYVFPPSIRGLGGRKNSHIANALEHSSNRRLIHLDITNFYDQIASTQVKQAFISMFGFDNEAANLLTSLTTYNGRLWQGLATSSKLAIICTIQFTSELDNYANEHKLHFSQYGDDLFFSASNLQPEEIAAFVISKARSFGLKVRRQKISVDGSGARKVTGALSNKSGTRAPKKLRKKTELYAKLYSRYGQEELQEKLRGSLLFLRQCRPADFDKLVKKYGIKFIKLKK